MRGLSKWNAPAEAGKPPMGLSKGFFPVTWLTVLWCISQKPVIKFRHSEKHAQFEEKSSIKIWCYWVLCQI